MFLLVSAPELPAAALPTQRRRILVVEDEQRVASLLVDVLAAYGYEARAVGTGSEATQALDEMRPDLVMLDIMLPDTDGLVLCSEIHARWHAPIIVVSGSTRQRDRILSLRLGADDFVAKPFDVDELVARIEAVLRRSGSTGQTPSDEAADREGQSGERAVADAAVCRVGELTIDHRRRLVTVRGEPVHVTPTEHRLLTTLATSPERVYSRDELANAVWGGQSLGESRAIDVHIRRLRAKLEPFGAAAPPIVTVRGFGYKLVPNHAEPAAYRGTRYGIPDGEGAAVGAD
jgi:DNA-binding response OmpR family regulator